MMWQKKITSPRSGWMPQDLNIHQADKCSHTIILPISLLWSIKQTGSTTHFYKNITGYANIRELLNNLIEGRIQSWLLYKLATASHKPGIFLTPVVLEVCSLPELPFELLVLEACSLPELLSKIYHFGKVPFIYLAICLQLKVFKVTLWKYTISVNQGDSGIYNYVLCNNSLLRWYNFFSMVASSPFILLPQCLPILKLVSKIFHRSNKAQKQSSNSCVQK